MTSISSHKLQSSIDVPHQEGLSAVQERSPSTTEAAHNGICHRIIRGDSAVKLTTQYYGDLIGPHKLQLMESVLFDITCRQFPQMDLQDGDLAPLTGKELQLPNTELFSTMCLNAKAGGAASSFSRGTGAKSMLSTLEDARKQVMQHTTTKHHFESGLGGYGQKLSLGGMHKAHNLPQLVAKESKNAMPAVTSFTELAPLLQAKARDNSVGMYDLEEDGAVKNTNEELLGALRYTPQDAAELLGTSVPQLSKLSPNELIQQLANARRQQTPSFNKSAHTVLSDLDSTSRAHFNESVDRLFTMARIDVPLTKETWTEVKREVGAKALRTAIRIDPKDKQAVSTWLSLQSLLIDADGRAPITEKKSPTPNRELPEPFETFELPTLSTNYKTEGAPASAAHILQAVHNHIMPAVKASLKAMGTTVNTTNCAKSSAMVMFALERMGIGNATIKDGNQHVFVEIVTKEGEVLIIDPTLAQFTEDGSRLDDQLQYEGFIGTKDELVETALRESLLDQEKAAQQSDKQQQAEKGTEEQEEKGRSIDWRLIAEERKMLKRYDMGQWSAAELKATNKAEITAMREDVHRAETVLLDNHYPAHPHGRKFGGLAAKVLQWYKHDGNGPLINRKEIDGTRQKYNAAPLFMRGLEILKAQIPEVQSVTK